MGFQIADISEALLLAGLGSSSTEAERGVVQFCLQAATGAVVKHLQYNPVRSTHTEYYPQQDMRRGVGKQGVWEVNDTEAYVRQISEASTDELQITHIPIRSITHLFIDYDGRFGTRSGSFGSGTEKTEGTDFWAQWELTDSAGEKVCTDGIIRSEGLWPDLPGSVKIEYVAGYTDAELHGTDSVINAFSILDAVLDETQRRVLKVYGRMKKRLAGFSGPLTSEGIGDYNYSSDAAALARLVSGGMDLLPETQHKLQEFVRYDLGVM